AMTAISTATTATGTTRWTTDPRAYAIRSSGSASSCCAAGPDVRAGADGAASGAGVEAAGAVPPAVGSGGLDGTDSLGAGAAVPVSSSAPPPGPTKAPPACSAPADAPS